MSQEFLDEIAQFGLESFGIFYGCYRGTVTDNEDPEMLGRIKLNCPAVHGEDTPDYWAESKGLSAFSIPAKGAMVWVSFENGNPEYPIWEYGHPVSDTVPETARRKKPTNHVFQVPSGHRIEVDEEKDYIKVTNKAGFIVEVAKDGINFGNAQENFGKLLGELQDEIQKIIVNTAMGPSDPLGPVNNPQFKIIQERFKTILKDGID